MKTTAAALCIGWLLGQASAAQELQKITDVEFQPLASATRRMVEAMEYLGVGLPEQERDQLVAILDTGDVDSGHLRIQEILDRRCLLAVHINPESRVKVREGPAPRKLIEQGWRTFLVKVHNEAGVTGKLQVQSPNAEPLYYSSGGSPDPEPKLTEGDLLHRFLDLELCADPPLKPRLSGLALEYRVLQLYSRDAGPREATFAFDVGQGTQDLGFRNQVSVLFQCEPAVEVNLEIVDFDGKPTTASLLIKDPLDRVYPSPGRRLAPDFFFHHQIYRESGESVKLPPGSYDVLATRGPEYIPQHLSLEVPNTTNLAFRVQLKRWIHLASMGWRSGDHHIHAAGCAHYESPTEGVGPADMMRHLVGEDVNVGCVLSWGPCWYFQKQFFEGKDHELSTPDQLLRYDVEVSGFPSSHAGHLSLLRLTEDDYPGTEKIEDWPSWDLPVLQWAKDQDAVTGFSHSGFGLQIESAELPNYEVPAYDSIGANEYIVDVVHGAVDFISTVDTPPHWELNIWYHTLNCGYRCRISGETDFPCIYGERVGMGRVYVECEDGPIDFDEWVLGLRDGRSYVSDGLSHLIDFEVSGVVGGRTNTTRLGHPGSGDEISQLDLDVPKKVQISARVAAFLPAQPNPELQSRPLDQKPFWHLERARLGGSREVPVELIVNGRSVARKPLPADGSIVDVDFEVEIERSSWIALRIFPSSHTNPIFIHVGGQPIRADRKSAEWCLKSVDRCWESKRPAIKPKERKAAAAAYEFARKEYRRILSECGDAHRP